MLHLVVNLGKTLAFEPFYHVSQQCETLLNLALEVLNLIID